jgi:hypothetical protein
MLCPVLQHSGSKRRYESISGKKKTGIYGKIIAIYDILILQDNRRAAIIATPRAGKRGSAWFCRLTQSKRTQYHLEIVGGKC